MSSPEPTDGNPSPGGTPSPSGQGMTPVATPPPAPETKPQQPGFQQQTPAAVPQSPTNQHRIELATGQVYTGNTYEDAVNSLKAGQEEASRTIENYKLQVRQLAAQQALSQNQNQGQNQPRQQNQPLQQQPLQNQRPPSGAFNKQQFEQLLDSDDPGEAIIYALQTKLGYNPMERLDEVHHGFGKINDLIEVGQFYQQDKDFPSNDPMSQKLLVSMASNIGNGIINSYSLQMAANQMRQNQLIPAANPGQQQNGPYNQPVGQYQQNPYTQSMAPSPPMSNPEPQNTNPDLTSEEAKWAEFARATGLNSTQWDELPFAEKRRLLEEHKMIEKGVL